MRTTQNILLGLIILAMGVPTLQAANNNSQKGRKSGGAWVSVGPANISGRILAIHVDNNNEQKIYAGTAGSGLWTTSNGGASWHRCMGYAGPVAVSAIVQGSDGKLFVGTGEGLNDNYLSPGVPNTVGTYGIAGNGIYVSTDGGKTFSHIESTEDWVEVNAMAYDAKNRKLYVATNEGLKVSTDDGISFSDAIQGSGGMSKTFDVKVGSDGSVICAIRHGGFGDVFVSTDNGESFSSVCGTDKLPSDLGRFSVAIAPSYPDIMYALAGNGSGDFGGVYVSTNKGDTWRAVFKPGGYDNPMGLLQYAGIRENAIAVSPTDPNRVLIGSYDLWEMWETDQIEGEDDLGNSLYKYARNRMIGGANIKSIFYRGKTVFLSTAHGIYYSNDDGISFMMSNRGLNTLQLYSMSVANDGRILAGTRENGCIYMPNPKDSGSYATPLTGGDGGQTAFSYLKTYALHYLSHYGAGYRQASIESGVQETAQWYGGKESSLLKSATAKYPRWGPREGGVSTDRIASSLMVWESVKDCNSKDTIVYTADKDYAPGEAICAKSVINDRYPVWTTNPKLDTLRRDSVLLVRDSVISRFFLGGGSFEGSGWEIGAPVYMSLTSISYDYAQEWVCVFRTGDIRELVMSLLMSSDGEHLFVLTWKEDIDEYTIYRVSGFDTYRKMEELDVFAYGYGDTTVGYFSPNPNRELKNDTLVSLTGERILSIALDPLNDDNLIYTLNSFGGIVSPRIRMITNATDATLSTAIIENKEGSGIPDESPVYTALKVFDPKNSTIDIAYIGTERGIYRTTNFSSNPPTWEKHNNGINIDVPVFQLLQQTKYMEDRWSENHDGGTLSATRFPGVSNYGVIYAATHGAGIFMENTYFEPLSTKEYPGSRYVDSKVKVYPNPATSSIFVDFAMQTDEQVQVNIVDIAGRVVYTEILGMREKGNHSYYVDCSYLSNGFYFVNVKMGKYNKTAKFVISK